MLTFRPYQQRDFNTCINFLNNTSTTKKMVGVAPPAYGKSLLIGALAEYWKGRTLVLQPTKELLEQNFNKFEGFGGKGSIFSASLGIKEVGHTTFATPKSIVKCLDLFEGVSLIIIDECHLQCKTGSVVDKIVKYFPKKCKVLGFTASPVILRNTIYGSKLSLLNRTRDSIFSDILFCCQIKEMIADGYWSRLEYKIYEQDESMLELNSTGLEYKEDSIECFYNENSIEEQIIELLNEHKERRKTLIFVPSINQATSLHSKIQHLYSSCYVVHSKLSSKERNFVMQGFKENENAILININIGGVGFDVPALDTIIHCSPTNSIARYYQNLGRGVRIFEDKEECLVLDLSGNVKKFGKIENLEFKNHEMLGWQLFSNDKMLSDHFLSLPLMTAEEHINERNMSFTNANLTFGKYKGKSIEQVAKEDLNYVSWLIREINGFSWGKIYNGAVIKKSLEQYATKYLSNI